MAHNYILCVGQQTFDLTAPKLFPKLVVTIWVFLAINSKSKELIKSFIQSNLTALLRSCILILSLHFQRAIKQLKNKKDFSFF